MGGKQPLWLSFARPFHSTICPHGIGLFTALRFYLQQLASSVYPTELRYSIRSHISRQLAPWLPVDYWSGIRTSFIKPSNDNTFGEQRLTSPPPYTGTPKLHYMKSNTEITNKPEITCHGKHVNPQFWQYSWALVAGLSSRAESNSTNAESPKAVTKYNTD